MKTALSLLGTSLLAGALFACAGAPGLGSPEAPAGTGSAPAPPADDLESRSPLPTEEAMSEPVSTTAASTAPERSEPMTAPMPVAPPGAAPSADAALELDLDSADEVGEASRARGAAFGGGGSRHRVSKSVARRKRGNAQLAGGVRAGEWDDNANYREFSRYLAQKRPGLDFDSLPVQGRRFLVVRDRHGKAVPNCALTVKDMRGARAELTTTASGRALLFPRAEGLTGNRISVRAHCLGTSATEHASLNEPDGLVDIELPSARALPRLRTVDVVFVLDTTGSMSEEIGALTGTIAQVAEALRQQNARPRLGLVEYRDVTDGYVTRLHQMTTDVDGFTERVGSLVADGGGDMPEHVNAGLRVAIQNVRWNPDSVARLAFLIGDAPPQLDYEQDVSYVTSAREASRRGIQIFTIAASGMDPLGQLVWRQIAQYTGGTNMFVLRGGAGPQSTGAGDAESSCGGTHKNYSSGNLAELITAKVEAQLASIEGDPLRIAGLGQDEKAKPCKDRIVLAR